MATIVGRQSHTTTGTKAGIEAKGCRTPFQAVLQVTVGTSATYDVEYTCDGNNWLVHPDGNDQTASAVFTFAYPITATRLVIAAISGALTAVLVEG